MKMTSADFKHLKQKVYDDKSYHEKHFLQRIDPDTIDAYFEGDPEKNYEKNGKSSVTRLGLNLLFPATETLLPSLYPSNPRFIGVAKRPNDKQAQLNAVIAASAANYYFEQMNANEANKNAVLSSWLYGLGWTKQGWQREVVNEKPRQTKL